MLRPWRPALRLSLLQRSEGELKFPPRTGWPDSSHGGKSIIVPLRPQDVWREVGQTEVAQSPHEEGRDRQVGASAGIEAALLQARIEQQRPSPQEGGIIGVLRERVQRRRFALHLDGRVEAILALNMRIRKCREKAEVD